MLLYIFLLLGTWTSVLGKDDKCRESRYHVCPLPDGWGFPKTMADLEQICPGFIQTIDCMKDHLKKCNPEDNLRRRYLQNLGDVTKDACDKDSQLHLRIVQNIDCFNEVVQNDSKTCYKGIDKKTGKMMKHIQKTEAKRH
ncbi:hypothetical protein HNY73_016728 [Argiope bruennichi]|uniref:Uncharacterized protein n=1 Tax=Argiope bruennichi TaxID=94029 RepID=A0A8T0ENB2_ARGBR|nr:hypothetical protein HNY73_016728 [Argiope bruennichi]